MHPPKIDQKVYCFGYLLSFLYIRSAYRIQNVYIKMRLGHLYATYNTSLDEQHYGLYIIGKGHFGAITTYNRHWWCKDDKRLTG